MGHVEYLKKTLHEMTFAVSIKSFIEKALKKHSEMDIRKWAKRTVRNPALDKLAKEMDINRLDIKNKLVKDKTLVFK